MNYIWEVMIRTKEKGIDEADVFFKYGKPFSGYMELSFEDMNETDILHEIEINPFYRYYSIFKELFEPNVNENEELVEAIHDLIIHHLKDIDVLMGMNKRDYYINFVIEDMKNGYFGDYIQEKIDIFTNLEKKIIANSILNLYKTNECMHLLKDTVSRIFRNAYIFSNISERDVIILFLRTKETKEKQEQIEVLKYLFLPFKCNVKVYWEQIFGILGVNEFMRNDEIMNY